MGTLVFITVLSILVIVHEYGHFITARKMGVHVERFAIGFGPKLLSRRIKGGTEFLICLIPLGGYVKMAGDERNDCTGKANEFYSKPIGQRSLIVLAGPIVNYVFAYICFCVVFMVGYPTMAPKVGELIDGYPAQEAGLLVGDTVKQIGQKKIENWEDLQKTVSRSKGKSLDFLVLRENTPFHVIVNPVGEEAENIFGQKIQSRFVGMRPEKEIILLRYGPLSAVVKAAQKLGAITTTTYKALYLMVTGGMAAKDAVTGPVGIFYMIKEAAQLGFSYVVYLMSVISASLAIFNLLPLPVLDGGHLFLFGIEKLRGKPLSKKVDEAIHRVGLSMIILLALFVFYTDFARYGFFDKIVYFAGKIGF
ncbi:MAG: RIP metalloprotease RseP [Candidatus Aceula meridiana]|nr:RIP metalloprotease RseP [Candidatus Aceula meridiana]